MSHPIRLRPELLDDAAEAYAWYEDRVEGLGDEFLKAFMRLSPKFSASLLSFGWSIPIFVESF